MSLDRAWPHGAALVLTVTFLVLTTISLQILSNLSNELGDTLRGTDSDDRQGKRYSLQDGDLSITDMQRLIATTATLCCIFGALMIYFSFGTFLAAAPLALLLLGATAIWAAVHYTLGKNPYGYRGGGDIAVFIFFGLVSVMGASFVLTHSIDPAILLPASSIGLFSVGVLNVNNIRDIKSDSRTRVTTAIRLGEYGARVYHTALICSGWCLAIAYICISRRWAELMCLVTLPLYARHLLGVWRHRDAELDPMLPLLVISTFLFALLLGLGSVIR